jgi:hypothetical protein
MHDIFSEIGRITEMRNSILEHRKGAYDQNPFSSFYRRNRSFAIPGRLAGYTPYASASKKQGREDLTLDIQEVIFINFFLSIS